MAGPWEKYQSAPTAPPSGPWMKYQIGPNAKAQIPPTEPEEASWGNVGSRLIQNSGRSLNEDLIQPYVNIIKDPIGFAGKAGDLIGGGIQSAGAALGLPGDQEDTQQKQAASALAEDYKNAYGSMGQFKETLAEHPFRVFGDASTVASLGGGASARLPGVIGRAGRTAQTLANTVDPIAVTTKYGGKVVGRGAREALGVSTGAGGTSYNIAKEAAQAPSDGIRSTNLHEGMRGGHGALEGALETAQDALAEMRNEKHELYLKNIAATKESKTPIDVMPITKKALELRRSLQHGGHNAAGKATMAHMDQIDEIVTTLQNDPAMHNAMGLDTFKRQLEDIGQEIPYNQRNTRRINTVMVHEIKRSIEKAVPSYKKAMRDYEVMSAAEKEIADTLSLKPSDRPDTAIRKLLSTLRDNVNTNYGQRAKLLDLLNERRPGLKETLAGASLNSWVPRGLAKYVAGSGVLFNPMTAGALPLTMPRVMGEATYYTSKFGPRAGRTARPLVYQTGRANENDQRNRGQY